MKGIKLVIFIGIPSSLGLAIFGYQILEMLFQRGAFTANDVMMANLGLQMFTIGLPFFMLMKVLVPCFFCSAKYQNAALCRYLEFINKYNLKLPICILFRLWSLRLSSWVLISSCCECNDSFNDLKF